MNHKYYTVQDAPEGGYLVTTPDGTFDNRFDSVAEAEAFADADQNEYDAATEADHA